ncbi:helix-turn-helix domain-containing protein [Nocardia gipuzkoensis]|uniref:helix-turn-helix domain-containing protein n=1 Tax=Nocardia gipuzkoensis TaxID=2749991 RepID=UPI00237E7783|nr:helix-turn-helix domain-containing protein [Nocardia gipuzkoensis]MDE1674768.1 helix-turn-helix domain-containing protein [Nocardia gipuzkoensis]
MTRTTNPARHPRRRQQDRASSSCSEVPDLGCWARRIRERRKLPRPRAADRLHISKEMLKKIENSDAPCSPAVLNHLVTAYNLDRAQERYTRDLARPPVALPPIAELRARTDTPEHRATLTYLDRREIAGAYIDPLWNVVLANERFTAGLPGIEQFRDNIALWFFHPGTTTPTAEPIVMYWDSAAAYLVATLRGALGRHRETPHALTLFHDLRAAATFSETWDTSDAVAYGRRPEEPVHLRDPTTGEAYSERIHLGYASSSNDVRFCVCYREPYPRTRSDRQC